MRVAVYIPAHTIGALCYGYLVWILTALMYLYYTVDNENSIIQSHRNRTVHVYNCKK